MKLTKQGVRDLNHLGPQKAEVIQAPPRQCLHKRMKQCCANPPCKHWHCPDCDLTYDAGNDW